MAILISLSLFLVLMAAISYFGYRQYARPARVYEQVGSATAFRMPALDQTSEDDPGLAVRVIEYIGQKLPLGADDAGYIRSDLIAAGYRSEGAATIYLGIRVLASVGLVLLAIALRPYLTSNPILAVVMPLGAAFLGYAGPGFALDHLVSARRERLRLALPDALDLLVVSVESGLGLDQAIQYVARELRISHIDLSEELEMVNLEIRGGRRRADALRQLGVRTGEGELRKLVAILVQTDRFGTSIAESLRTHSDFMRVRRRQEAEERAGKVGVKLVFPIFFLMLPAMIVVAAGPGLLQIFKYLFPMMRQYQQF